MVSSVLHFLLLPTEIRLRIYTYYLYNTELHADNNIPTLHSDDQPLVTLESTEDADSNDRSDYVPPPQRPYYYIRQLPEILYVNKLIHYEVISLRWQSLVRYNFLSTIAMLDVLTAMPFEQRQLVRRVRVVGTYITLDFQVFQMPCCLVLLKGLELDLFEIMDPYPGDLGDQTDYLAMFTVRWLLLINGWKEARIIVGDYLSREAHIKDLTQLVESLRSDRNEVGLQIEFPTSPIECDSSLRLLLSSEFVRNQQAWNQPSLNVIIRRGDGANYTQTGDEFWGRPFLRRMEHVHSWAELRKSSNLLRAGERLADL